MLNSTRRSLGFAARLAALAAEVGWGSASTTWQKSHPRQGQLQHRPAEPVMPLATSEIDPDIEMLPRT